MKKIIKLTLIMMIFITVSCEKSHKDPLEGKPPAIYDDIELNEINITMGIGFEQDFHDFDVTLKNSKLYFNLHSKTNSHASLYSVLVNFEVDSFPFVIGSSNIANLVYESLNDYGVLENVLVSSFNGGFPSGYFVIDFIDTLDLIVYGYLEFMNIEDPSYLDYFKIQKSYFKLNYELGPNSLENNSADIFVNENRLHVIDMSFWGLYQRINSWIVFDDNSALQIDFFREELEVGINHTSGLGINAALLKNVDFNLSYFGFPPDAYSQSDSGYIDIQKFNTDERIIEGDLNIYFKSDNLTGNFKMNY